MCFCGCSRDVFACRSGDGISTSFDTAADLTSNFNLNVLPGDSSVNWRSGYGPSGVFSGSDGGFAHFNNFPTSDSIGFKIGEVFLNSFDVSSQWYEGGSGVSAANAAGNDFRLNLYDSGLNLVFTADYFLPANGDWTTITVNTPGVYAIQIVNAMGINPGQGFFANIDNIVFNEATGVVPEPATLFVWSGLGLPRLARSTPVQEESRPTASGDAELAVD